jgi:hypothetical protein
VAPAAQGNGGCYDFSLSLGLPYDT